MCAFYGSLAVFAQSAYAVILLSSMVVLASLLLSMQSTPGHMLDHSDIISQNILFLAIIIMPFFLEGIYIIQR